MAREYGSATAFRNALEDRLNRAAQMEQTQVNRMRRQVAFDRLLARLFPSDAVAPWALKGGYALELRFRTARATIDIDLTIARIAAATEAEANEILRDMLQSAAELRLGDWFEYRIGPPVMDLDGAPDGGARFPVEARMDGRIFARFHLDVGIGDEVIQPLEMIACRDWLDFAGIPAPIVQAISWAQQFAEKIHAYTLPRDASNSRVKDLVDMVLLIRSDGVDPRPATEAVRTTFRRRRTHDLPSKLLPPPQSWQGRFKSLSAECGFAEEMEAAFSEVTRFYESLRVEYPGDSNA